MKDVVGFESVLVRIHGRTFIPPEDFRPTATNSQYNSRNDVTVAVDDTPIPISPTNPAPLARTAGYLITQEFPRPQGALLTTFDSNANEGTALTGLGGADGPHPEGFLLMPEGFTFGADPAPSSLPSFGRECPYPADPYRFALVTEEEFPRGQSSGGRRGDPARVDRGQPRPEPARHPAARMPGARAVLRRLHDHPGFL